MRSLHLRSVAGLFLLLALAFAGQGCSKFKMASEVAPDGPDEQAGERARKQTEGKKEDQGGRDGKAGQAPERKIIYTTNIRLRTEEFVKAKEQLAQLVAEYKGLIVHSEDDLRCPIGQAEQLFVALKRLGREVVLVRFPDENHELSRSGKPRHRLERFRIILDWFGRQLSP